MSYVRSHLDENKFSPKDIGIIIYLIVVTFGFFILLYLSNSLQIREERSELIRTLFVTLGPLLAFSFYLLVSGRLLNYQLESSEERSNLSMVLLLSVLGIYFAISLNSRAIFLAITFIALDFTLESSILILFSIITPLIEEFVKIYPALIMARHIKFDGNRQQRYVKQLSYYVFFAAIGGAIFNLLETYWYTWTIGLQNQDIISNEFWPSIYVQLFLRSTNPLHIVSSMIAGLGIFQALYHSEENELNRSNFLIFIPYFIAAVVLHGIWNASAILNEDVTNFYNLPLVNYILYLVMIPTFIVIIYYVRSFQYNSCSECGNFHTSGLIHHEETNLNVSTLFRKENTAYPCNNCQSPIFGKSCEVCQAVEVYSCYNCKYPLPIYANKCWRCEKPVKLIYDNLTVVPTKATKELSKNFFFLFATLYFAQMVGLFILILSIGGLSFANNQLTLYFIISGALGAGIYLNISTKHKEWGLVISNYLSSLILLLLIILFVVIVTLFFQLGLALTSFLIILVVIIYSYLSFKLLIQDTIYVRDKNE